MFLLRKKIKAIKIKRLEGNNLAREGTIMFGILTFNSKKYVIKRPMHALGLVSIGAILLHRRKNIKHSAVILSQLYKLSRLTKTVTHLNK